MTDRQRRRHEMLCRISSWMRQHGAWFVFVLCFSAVSENALFAAEMKAIQEKQIEQKNSANVLTTPAPSKSIAKTQKKKDDVVVEKTVKGTVAFIRKNRMAVALPSAEEGGEELFLALDSGIKVKKAKSLSEIVPGDEVTVKYLETSKKPKTKDEKPFVLSRVGMEITLTKKLKPVGLALLESQGALNE